MELAIGVFTTCSRHVATSELLSLFACPHQPALLSVTQPTASPPASASPLLLYPPPLLLYPPPASATPPCFCTPISCLPSCLPNQTTGCQCRAMGCGMLPAAAPAAALYSGCAFNDAAAMAGSVTRLEAELALAKAALADRHASEEGLHRQKRALEADVARLHAEVPFCHLDTAVHTFFQSCLQSLICSFIHRSVLSFRHEVMCHIMQITCMIEYGIHATSIPECIA